MRETKRERLEAKGWRIGGAKEFLALLDQEAEYIELKLKLAEGLRRRRSFSSSLQGLKPQDGLPRCAVESVRKRRKTWTFFHGLSNP